jgi:hypothetical protein
LIIIGYVSTAVGGILFYDDCEDTPNTSDWKLQTTGDVSFSVSSEQAKAGSNSYKYVNNGGKSWRVEHAIIKRSVKKFNYDTVYWIGYSFYLSNESGYENGSYGQFHGSPDLPVNECDQYRNGLFFISPDTKTGGIVIAQKAQLDRCAYDPKGLVYDREVYHKISRAFTKGQWHDIVMQFRFSYVKGGGGFFKIWLDGTQILDDKDINCYNDALGPYWKMGVYGTLAVPVTAYYDEFRVGDSNSSYDEVSPKGPKTISLNAPLLKIVN